MRVITGSARGRRLITLEGDDVRPTTDIVKEALFSIIQFEIEGRNVLDLFGGCGQLAIEALSRGARSATIVDLSKKSVEIIKKNVNSTGFTNNAFVVNSDATAFLSRTREKFDIALLDPPYSKGLIEKALENHNKMEDVMEVFADVQRITHCSTGCGGCHDKVLDVISQIMMG